MNSGISFPVGSLAPSILPYFCRQLFDKLPSRYFFLQEKRKIAILKAERFHAFVGKTARVKMFTLGSHACIEALCKAQADALF